MEGETWLDLRDPRLPHYQLDSEVLKSDLSLRPSSVLLQLQTANLRRTLASNSDLTRGWFN